MAHSFVHRALADVGAAGQLARPPVSYFARGRGQRMNSQGDRVGLIWSIAELLRHDYKPSD
jgi:hypothetical protein